MPLKMFSKTLSLLQLVTLQTLCITALSGVYAQVASGQSANDAAKTAFNEAYAPANQGDFVLGVYKMSKIPAESPYYAQAQEKIQLWMNILKQRKVNYYAEIQKVLSTAEKESLKQEFQEAYTLAVQNDFVTAVYAMEKISPASYYYPQALEKIQTWRNILKARGINYAQEVKKRNLSGASRLQQETPSSPSENTASNPTDTEFYRRKHISFFFEEPEIPLNQVLKQKFEAQVERFDYHLINSELASKSEAQLLPFLTAVQAHQNKIAGDLAATNRKSFNRPDEGELRFGSQVVTWAETQDIAASAYVFGSHWSFSPIKLQGPFMRIIQEDSEGRLNTEHLPAGAYTISRTVKQKRYNSKTKQDEEVSVRQLLYWEVVVGSDLDFQQYVYKLRTVPPSRHFRHLHSWFFGDDYVVTNSDFSQAQRFLKEKQRLDLLENLNSELILQIARFQALKQRDPYQVYMDRAVSELRAKNDWFEDLLVRMKKDEDFKLKSQVVAFFAEKDLSQIAFGDVESAQSLGVKTNEWYERIEKKEVNGEVTKNRLGFEKIRGFYEDDGLSQIISGRTPELGDQLLEYPMRGISMELGAGVGGVFGLNEANGAFLSGRYSLFPAPKQNAETFSKILDMLKKAPENKTLSDLELALKVASMPESDTFVHFLLGAGLRGSFLGLDLGYRARYYHRSLVWGYSVAPSLFYASRGEREGDLLFGLVGGPLVEYIFSPEFRIGGELNVGGYIPFNGLLTLKGYLDFSF